MEIFDLLKSDHKQVASLLRRLGKTPQSQSSKRDALFLRLQEEFMAHAAAEEEAVYTPLKAKDKMKEYVRKSYKDHSAVELQFNLISNLSSEKDAWAEKVITLSELIEQHVEDEENIFFKKIESVCDEKELSQMAREFKAFKIENVPFHWNKKQRPNQSEMWMRS